ncbi:MAG: BamA/TamA family outer membrane protein [Myxococcaceae bacterium]|nr:BamA/TamA family outer membrane protein [Myxococcaceae bacterium]
MRPAVPAERPGTPAPGTPNPGEQPGRDVEVETPPIVVGVELHLPPGTDPTGIPEQIAVARNQPLSLRAVRRSIERLYATGRFADVVARRVEVPGGIRVIFEVTPKQRIGALAVDGERVLSEAEVLAASGLEVGDEYYPELLQRAAERVRERYVRRGYRQAKVTTELHEVEQGTEVLIAVQEGPPTLIEAVTVGGNPGLPIARVVGALNARLGGVLDMEALEAGLERLKALYRSERYYRARVGEPEVLPGEKGGVVLAVPVIAGPRYTFHFHGNRSFPDKLLEGILAWDGGEALDQAVMERLARRVASFYQYRGFHDVRVTPREVQTPTRSEAVVAFHIEEGRPLYVRAITFVGNKAMTDQALRRILREQILSREPEPRTEVPFQSDPLNVEGRTSGGARPPAPEPRPLTVFVAEAYAEAARAMRDAYREQGFLSAQVSVPAVRIDVNDGTAEVTFKIVEGPQAVVREIKYRGLPPGFDPSKAILLKVGEPFRASGVDESRRALIRALGREGYLFARVEPSSSVSPDGKNANVFFGVDAGPHVKVGEVIVRGLRRSNEAMVRANVLLRPGDVMDPEKLFESQRNLVLLGIFKSVAVRLLEPEQVEATKDVVIDVKERPRLSGELSGGYSLVDGPRLVGDLSYPNLWGSATSLTARAKINYVGASALILSDSRINPDELTGLDGIDGRLNVAVVQPRIHALLPVRLGVRGDLIAERVHRPTFNFARLAGVVGADWAASQWMTLSLQYEAEQYRVNLTEAVQRLASLGSPELERFRFASGNFSLHSLRPSVTLDFRDDFARPSKGILFNGSAELTQDLRTALGFLGANTSQEFPIYSLKLSGSLSGYVPIAPRVVLASSVRGGTFVHLSEDSRSIAPKRFFMGGATSMRGFREDGLLAEDRRKAIRADLRDCRILAQPRGCTPEADLINAGQEVPSEGGEIFMLVKSELRFPIYGAFDLGLFFEAGNLWLDQSQFTADSWYQLRYVAGTGIRYGTPIGPIALDLGINLVPDLQVNEPRANAHFSIGLF